MQDLGIIIGRFQPFHKWHKLLFDTAIAECKSVLVLIGSSNKTDTNNPYSYELRKEIIEAEISGDTVFIWDLPDFDTDGEWIRYILSYIPQAVNSCTLYCGDESHDSAVAAIISSKESFHFDFIIKEIPRSIIPISATQVRKYIKNWENEKLEDFLLPSTIEKVLS